MISGCKGAAGQSEDDDVPDNMPPAMLAEGDATQHVHFDRSELIPANLQPESIFCRDAPNRNDHEGTVQCTIGKWHRL